MRSRHHHGVHLLECQSPASRLHARILTAGLLLVGDPALIFPAEARVTVKVHTAPRCVRWWS